VPYLRGYQLQNVVAFPVAAFLEAAEAAAEEALGGEGHVIDSIRFDRALVFDSQAEEAVQLILETNGSEAASFRLFSRQPDGPWQLHTSGRVRPLRSDEEAPRPEERLRKQIEATRAASCDPPGDLRTQSAHDGGSDAELTRTREAWREGNQVLTQTTLPEAVACEAQGYAMHPALLDACLAVMGSIDIEDAPRSSLRYVPTAVGQLRWYAHPRPSGTLWTHAVCEAHLEDSEDSIRGNVRVWDDDQTPILEVSGLQLRRIHVASSSAPAEQQQVAAAASAEDRAQAAEAEARRCLEAFRTAGAPHREATLSEYLRARIACTLDTRPGEVDSDRPLTLLGIDSLMAMEIKNRVETELNTEVPIVTVLEGPTIFQLSKMLLEKIDREASQPQPAAEHRQAPGNEETKVAGEEAAQLLGQLDDLSDKDVDALMHRMLAEKCDDE
jgi:acyl carrier protein